MLAIVLLISVSAILIQDAIASCVCGIENKGSRIIGGTVVSENNYPWMALLVMRKNRGYTQCGGSIINDRYVLTAAHCIQDVSEVRVAVGTNRVPSLSRMIVAESYVSHPNYNDRTHHNDIALVKLSKPLQFTKTVRPICLPKAGQGPSGSMTIAGWGRTEKGTTSNILLEVSVTEYPFARCNREWGYKLVSSQFCAANIGRDSCGGDSGGPLMLRDSGKVRVVGLVSYGVSDCGSKENAVYTKVSSFLDFIQQNTEDGIYCSEN